MSPLAANELVLVRHAPSDSQGLLCGRRDVAARLGDDPLALARLGALLAGCALVVASPARRCRETAGALFPGRAIGVDARLWEQDFGDHDGLAPAELPDLGRLPRAALADHRPPGGESFSDMVGRARPALRELAGAAGRGGPVAVVAHAGTVRAALALALDDVPAALAFEVAPLSLTRLRCMDGTFSIVLCNGMAA